MIQQDPDELRDQLREQIDSYLLGLTINRVVGAVERRVGESLNLRPNQFQDMEWQEVADILLEEVDRLLERQYERLVGDKDGGQIARDLDNYLSRLTDYTTDENQLVDLLGIMMEGQRLVFDRRTHRQSFQKMRRLNYAFLSAQMIQDMPPEQVTDMVLDQLQGAQEVLREVWGRYEMSRLTINNNRLEQLDDRIKARLISAMGKERFDELSGQPLDVLEPEERQTDKSVLGQFDQNEAARQASLTVISDCGLITHPG